MASSRENRRVGARALRRSRFGAAAAVLAFALALAGAFAPSAAWAAEREEPPVTVESVSLSDLFSDASYRAAPGSEGLVLQAEGEGSGRAPVARFGARALVALEAIYAPEQVEVGIDCGMEWMCGLDPCLCGAADEWGCCACNGTEMQAAEVRWSCDDEEVASIVEVFGTPYLAIHRAGDARLTCTVSAAHHADAALSIPIEVPAGKFADLSPLTGAVALILVVAGLAGGLAAHARSRRGRSGR